MAEEQKNLEIQRQERELRELIAKQQARQQADAARAASAARAKALNEYILSIQIKVKSGWILPQDIQGNPQAIFDVVQLPTGEVLDQTRAFERQSGLRRGGGTSNPESLSVAAARQ